MATRLQASAAPSRPEPRPDGADGCGGGGAGCSPSACSASPWSPAACTTCPGSLSPPGPAQADHVRLRRQRASTCWRRSPSRTGSNVPLSAGPPGRDQRGGVDRGPPLLHRRRPQPGQHRAGVHLRRPRARATCRGRPPSPSSTSSRRTCRRSAASPARSKRRPWRSGWPAQSPSRRSCRTTSTPSTGAGAPTASRRPPRPTSARTSASWASPRRPCWPA